MNESILHVCIILLLIGFDIEYKTFLVGIKNITYHKHIDEIPSPADIKEILSKLLDTNTGEQMPCNNLIYATNSTLSHMSFPLSEHHYVRYLDPVSLKKKENELKLQLAATRQRIALFDDTEKYVAQGPPKRNTESLEEQIILKKLEDYEKAGKLKPGEAKEIIESATNEELEVLLVNLAKL